MTAPLAAAFEGKVDLLFVLGSGRCGSTFTSDLLCLHPDTGFVTNYQNRWGIDAFGLTRRLYQRMPPAHRKRRGVPYPNEGYRALQRDVSALLVAPYRDVDSGDLSPFVLRRLRTFFAQVAARQKVGHVTHKFTGWPRARLLAAAFPEARFVHVVRDGRAVVNSMLQQPWWSGFAGPEAWAFGPLSPEDETSYEDSGRRFDVLAAIQWKALLAEFSDAASEIGPTRWMTVRYEDLVEDVTSHVLAIAAHGGLAESSRFVRALGRAPVHRDRTANFRQDLGAAAIERIERICEPTLSQYGYST